MKKLILLLLVGFLITLSACEIDGDPPKEQESIPVISGVEDVEFYAGNPPFEVSPNITAYDSIDGNITYKIIVEGTVDFDTPGEYILTYSVTNTLEITTQVSCTVTILYLEASYPTGFFNYKFADVTLRLNFMAAAEKYLMEGMIGGVPIYANSEIVAFSNRMILPYDEYLPEE